MIVYNKISAKKDSVLQCAPLRISIAVSYSHVWSGRWYCATHRVDTTHGGIFACCFNGAHQPPAKVDEDTATCGLTMEIVAGSWSCLHRPLDFPLDIWDYCEEKQERKVVLAVCPGRTVLSRQLGGTNTPSGVNCLLQWSNFDRSTALEGRVRANSIAVLKR